MLNNTRAVHKIDTTEEFMACDLLALLLRLRRLLRFLVCKIVIGRFVALAIDGSNAGFLLRLASRQVRRR
jgi:hypothetical protein